MSSDDQKKPPSTTPRLRDELTSGTALPRVATYQSVLTELAPIIRPGGRWELLEDLVRSVDDNTRDEASPRRER